jgi:hypothetical protein
MTLTITAPLNLPKLPPNHFWRLVDGAFHIDELQLRKKVWFFSVKVDDAMLSFYRAPKGLGRVGVYEPKQNIEAAARRLHFAFTTGKPTYEAPHESVAATKLPITGMSLTEVEESFDLVYAGYRKDYL